MIHQRLVTLAIECTYNNSCIALLDEDKYLYYDTNATFRPDPGMEKDSPAWEAELSAFHSDQISRNIDQTLARTKTVSKDIDFVSFSILAGRNIQNPRIQAGHQALMCFSDNLWPVESVDHIQAHICSGLFEHSELRFPFISLLASGGTTHLYIAHSCSHFQLIGTHENSPRNQLGHGRAAGAVLDDCAFLLGIQEHHLPDGAVLIDTLSRSRRHEAYYPFESIRQANRVNGYDFDFHDCYLLIEEMIQGRAQDYREYLAVSLQNVIMSILLDKAVQASREFNISQICCCGGSAANSHLRELAIIRELTSDVRIFFPSRNLCTDNAIMIGLLGLLQCKEKFTNTALLIGG